MKLLKSAATQRGILSASLGFCLLSAACARAGEPGDSNCQPDGAGQQAALICQITASGRTADTVEMLAGRVTESLGKLPRVSDVTLRRDIKRSNGQPMVLVKYSFRGPRKLADSTQRLTAASALAPAGYSVVPGGAGI